MFRDRPRDKRLPPTDTGDFCFPSRTKSSTLGLAATRQVSRPVRGLETRNAEYLKVPPGDECGVETFYVSFTFVFEVKLCPSFT